MMTWFFVFCIGFIVTVITVTVILVRKAVKEVTYGITGEINGRPKTLWEEEEEDDPYCVM